MASFQLEKETYHFALNLHYRRKDVAMVVGAEYIDTRSIAFSGLMPLSQMDPTLRRKLISIGPIGSKKKNTSIGCCAEVNAANPIYIKHQDIHLTDIELSSSYRPKTMQVKSKCHVCTEIFIRKWLTV